MQDNSEECSNGQSVRFVVGVGRVGRCKGCRAARERIVLDARACRSFSTLTTTEVFTAS